MTENIFRPRPRLTSLSRDNKVGKDQQHTAHDDDDDQSDNDAVKGWICVIHDNFPLASLQRLTPKG